MKPVIQIVAATGSTNADLAAHVLNGNAPAEHHWLIADRQSAGRGRQGRDWSDGAGNFMGSTALKRGPHDPPASSLALLAGLAVYEATSAVLSQPAALSLKWPNDLLLRGAKVAGVLLEGVQDHIIVGIGVNLASAPSLPDRSTASLAEIAPAPCRDLFAASLTDIWQVEVARWRQFGLDPVLRRWTMLAHREGSALTIHEPDGSKIAGKFAGLAPDGALQLRLADGTVRTIHAGDVTVNSASEGN